MPSLMSEIYLDNAATTRVRPEVVAGITESMRVNYGGSSRQRTGRFRAPC